VGVVAAVLEQLERPSPMTARGRDREVDGDVVIVAGMKDQNVAGEPVER
jgi:hypothetical protein